ncbi:oxidoreductase [Planosporangium flavigriseum]|uniref:Ferredoxin n=1 Tax=Planosporangium flavigriseum TaxID=373681 RepID=A0A8J3LMI9_9ACTN|nr:PDR/VanB family oxidoreductase [Planosporangium flavigriseum]NJC66587.1 oxidoreductase [Planosporangium flavigriseum]GIG73460.1 ferredoxin [Planosporangium flavigriseum]
MRTVPDEVEVDLVVHERREPAAGVVTVDLRDPSGAELPAWAAGAHIDLVLTDDLVRQYSLCGDPGDRTTWRVAVLREPDGRGGSAFAHDKLQPGATVRVRGPRNHFPLVPAPRYVFIAGGIGITPILPMLAAATAAGADWRLTYGGRSAASMAFADELCAAHPDRVVLRPQDEYGLLDLDAILGEPAADTLVYCCGPGPLLDAVEQRCARWPSGALHVERFAPKEQGAPVLSGAFDVELAVTGTTLTVPVNRSVLEVVEEAGVQVLSSCREGTCGTCETTVLAGQVDHRDSLLTEEERSANDTMFICVSRAACPTLVLEL